MLELAVAEQELAAAEQARAKAIERFKVGVVTAHRAGAG